MRAGFTLSVCDRRERVLRLWGMLDCLVHHSAWPVWQWVSDGLGRNFLGGSHWPLHASLIANGTGMKSSETLSDLTLVQWALGHPWCMTMPSHMWPDCVGIFWMVKALISMTGPHSEHPKPQSSLSDYLGVHWHPDPGLGGDQDTIRHLIRSLPRQCQECILAHGGHTD